MSPPAAVIAAAVDAANRSICQKSKRGAVLFRWNMRGELVICGTAFNGPPMPFQCRGVHTCVLPGAVSICNRVAVHAEERVLLNCRERYMSDCELVHIKTVDGQPVPSGLPSCWQCSRMVAEAQILRTWLLHENGWHSYSHIEFHAATLAFHRWPDSDVLR